MTQPCGRMDYAVQRAMVWTGPALVLLVLGGMIPLARFIPPPSPTASSQEIAALFAENTGMIRLACIAMMLGFALFGTWSASLVVWTRRLEPDHPILTYGSLICLGTGLLFLEAIPVVWVWAAFRPSDIDPDITRTLNDLGWILFEWVWPPFAVWLILMAVAIFRDVNETPFFPRWVAYMHLWVSVSFVPGSLMAYFRTGPFAFDGVFALYLPLGAFFVWMVAMTAVTLRLISRHEKALGQSPGPQMSELA